MRWVVADAGLDLDDAAIDAALAQGGGSARDTLSALELIASAGALSADALSFDDFLDALIDHDPGLALTAMAHAVNAGHEPRAIAEALVRHLRDGFLSLMAPELVQLSGRRSTSWPPRPSGSGRPRWCGPSSGSARSSSSCATPRIRGCSSRSASSR